MKFLNWLSRIFASTTATNRKDEARSIRSAIKNSVLLTLVLTLLLLLTLFLFFKENKAFAILSILTVTMAFFISGCVLGFVFGIPKKYQNKQATVQLDKEGRPIAPEDPNYTDNSSLEEISDWITKIVIGLSMIQFKAILGMMRDAANNINESLQKSICADQTCHLNFYVFSYALIVFYPIAGAIIGYLWTRIEFPYILNQKDIDLKVLKDLQNEKRKAENRLNKANELNTVKDEDLRALVQTFTPATNSMIKKRKEFKRSQDLPDDPQKGLWGGKSEADGRKVTAVVRETSYDRNWFNINLTVTSTDPNNPLVGDVLFHLHPSFMKEIQKVRALDGVAQCNIVGWGAFTVGVECDEGKTKLEIDLAELTDAPELFRKR
ncbi:pYEATS domain-containing protein [Pedobacter sp. KR3-3]|uniref:PYEATS domain-containing protein n=1 Tax=Pedobacter albus TaxID=3113905 RepID=A0ABU7IA46_9SPHI|nr:pYEATS domain-containing protein [Pedobacter sp. KR3-3]MEE1946151.1 pYEATS domain-containing protein [Pedobacter sp. KR3-3]